MTSVERLKVYKTMYLIIEDSEESYHMSLLEAFQESFYYEKTMLDIFEDIFKENEEDNKIEDMFEIYKYIPKFYTRSKNLNILNEVIKKLDLDLSKQLKLF